MLDLHLLFVNIMSVFIRLLVNFSFESENGSRRIVSFRTSHSDFGNIKSFLPLLKFSMVFLIKFLGRPGPST